MKVDVPVHAVDRGLGRCLGGREVRPSGVIHAGGHHGEEAAYYASHGVETVVWFEAEPDAFEVLTRTVAQYPGQHCVHALLADRDGDVRPFYRHRFPAGAKRGYCSTLPWNRPVVEHDRILSRLETFDVSSMSTLTVATALRERRFEPDQFQYLSINVQGAELMVLDGLGEYLAPIQWIFCEAEATASASRYEGAPAVADVTRWLSARGFRIAEPSAGRQQVFYRDSRG